LDLHRLEGSGRTLDAVGGKATMSPSRLRQRAQVPGIW
jgi:hypothetical protein